MRRLVRRQFICPRTSEGKRTSPQYPKISLEADDAKSFLPTSHAEVGGSQVIRLSLAKYKDAGPRESTPTQAANEDIAVTLLLLGFAIQSTQVLCPRTAMQLPGIPPI